jgi:hypothetical protein
VLWNQRTETAGQTPTSFKTLRTGRGALPPGTPRKATEITRKGNLKDHNQPVQQLNRASQFSTLFPYLAVQQTQTTAMFHPLIDVVAKRQ